ncbi:MAG TPA: hypothetical protein VMY37_38230 [Thermoguttaceae bacterium]|nr:hypothetical protein [Thermoguttaceae bacterium]
MRSLRTCFVLAAVVVLAACRSSFAAEGSGEAAVVSARVGPPAGIRRLRPETWGLVGLNVFNGGDQPADVVATMYFSGDPSLQYARRLWVPARARRYSWCPILPPRSIAPETPGPSPELTKAEVKSLSFDRSGPREELVRNRSEPVLRSRLLPIHHGRPTTAVVTDSGADDPAKAREDEAALEVVSASRQSTGLSPIVPELYEDFLPPVVESLDGLDQLVLAGDRLASDAAARVAVRRWLLGGGRLWIMLDRVEPETVELLLGEAFRCRVVDRVGLTRVAIRGVSADAESFTGEPREFEQPVDLVRVLAPDAEEVFAVNGWPAAFWQRMGKGEVLFTTLGAAGWIRSPGYGAPPSVATKPLEFLSFRLFRRREPPLLEPREWEAYLSEQIGYRIVGRGFVAGVLGAFCLVLLGTGAWLGRRDRLERMAWIGPLAAAIAALALAVTGSLARHSVPPTVAVAQLAEADPRSDELGMTGLLAIYNRQPSRAPLGVQRGGLFCPDMAGLGSTTRRMVWTDLDRWHWEHLPLPAGVRTAPFAYATKLARPIAARAAFGPDGLTGTLAAGPFESLADAVIATPSRANLSVELEASGRLHAGADEVLAPGRFIAASVLSDEQRRRQAIYAQVLDGKSPREFPDRPTLLAWARPLDMQFTFPDQTTRAGSAILTVPLEIERTPPGTRVAIPSPFLDYRSVRGPLREPSAAYGNATHEWIELRTSTEAYLRFQVPEQVLPIKLDRARVVVRINAPSRTVQLLGHAGQRWVSLATWNSPVGGFPLEITDTELLELDDQGGFLLGIAVARDRSSEAGTGPVTRLGSAWRIEAVELEIEGETLEPSHETQAQP